MAASPDMQGDDLPLVSGVTGRRIYPAGNGVGASPTGVGPEYLDSDGSVIRAHRLYSHPPQNRCACGTGGRRTHRPHGIDEGGGQQGIQLRTRTAPVDNLQYPPQYGIGEGGGGAQRR